MSAYPLTLLLLPMALTVFVASGAVLVVWGEFRYRRGHPDAKELPEE